VHNGSLEHWAADLAQTQSNIRLKLDKLPECERDEANFTSSVVFNFPQNEMNGYTAHPQTEYWVYTDPSGEECARTINYTFPRIKEVSLPTGSTLVLTEYDSVVSGERTSHMEAELASVVGGSFSQNLFVTDIDGDGAVDQISDTGDLKTENKSITNEDFESGVALHHIIDMRRNLLIESIIIIEVGMILEELGEEQVDPDKIKEESESTELGSTDV
jgi:hypothetical protein